MEEIVDVLGEANDRLGVGRERDRAIDPRADAHLPECGQAVGGALGQALEPLVVGGKQRWAHVPWNRAPAGAGALFPAADDQRTRLRLEVEPGVGVAEGGQVGGEVVALLGDDVLVLDGVDRDVDPGQPRGLRAPHAGRVDQHVAFDPALLGEHCGDPPAVALD